MSKGPWIVEDIGIGEVQVHVPLSGPDGGDIGLARTRNIYYPTS